jgi:hypothetical protein
VPAGRRSRLADWLCRCLVICLAVLLAAGPWGHAPVQDAGLWLPAGATSSPRFLEEPEADDPVAGLRWSPPPVLGLLSRAAPVEPSPGLPPPKASLQRPGAAVEPLLASGAIGSLQPQGELHRSSIGTARTPTGPPS